MGTQKETRLKIRAFRELSKLRKIWFVKTQFVALCGIPDIIGVYKGLFFAWELKVDKKKPSRLQRYVLERIEKAGGHVASVWPETLEDEIKKLKSSRLK